MSGPTVPPLRKKKRRQLSSFMAQEMLYEYLSHNLDSERQQAMDAFVPTCAETQKELENLQRGIAICQQLRQVQVHNEALDHMANAKSRGERLVLALNPKNWPEFLRWGAEAFVISLIVAGVAVVVPWTRISRVIPKRSTDITLTEIKHEPPPKMDVVSSPVAAPTLAPVAIESSPPPRALPTPKPQTAAQVATTEALEEGMPVSAVKGPAKGVLYRAFMVVDDSSDIAQPVLDTILDLGGVKGGQVELGWNKPGGKYYHLILPESNFAQFQKRLKSLGPVRFSKESHSRVMPSGQIRIILWVEDKNLQQ
jgi:hypothetical protein